MPDMLDFSFWKYRFFAWRMVVAACVWLCVAISTHAAEVPSSQCPATRETVEDFVLRDGTLRGCVVSARAESSRDDKTPTVVRIVRGSTVVAVASAGSDGRFAVSNLSGGVHVISVTGPEGTSSRAIRLWTQNAAPPRAKTLLAIRASGSVVRGQSPLRSPAFRNVATVAGVAGGFVAVPVIYAATRDSRKIPASP